MEYLSFYIQWQSDKFYESKEMAYVPIETTKAIRINFELDPETYLLVKRNGLFFMEEGFFKPYGFLDFSCSRNDKGGAIDTIEYKIAFKSTKRFILVTSM